MSDFVFELVLPVFIGAMALALVGLLGGLAVEAVQTRRAFDATVACEAKQMQARRQTFGSKVVCIPNPARRDTVGVTMVKP